MGIMGGFLSKLGIASKWRLAFEVFPFLVIIIVCKLISHYLDWEFLSLTSLFAAIISANIFLIGFLVSGVLVDYKESEKIPGDLACSIETIVDEALILYRNKKAEPAKNLLVYLEDFTTSVIDWLYKKERTEVMFERITGLNDFFLDFEPLTQANFIARLKQEQNSIRRMITRIHTVRETSFVGTGYAIAELISVILIIGLILVKLDPYYESVFFVMFVSFVLIYMLFFMKDLDNPFGYYLGGYVEDVSLRPLADLQTRLNNKLESLKVK